MAFFAAGLVKGAQHVRREVKKNRARNAIISADGEPGSQGGSRVDSLSIEHDWWGGDGGSYIPDIPIAAKDEEEEASVSVPLAALPFERAPIPQAEELPLALPPVVSSPSPSPVDLPPPAAITPKRRPGRQKSNTVAGSFMAKLEENSEGGSNRAKSFSSSSETSTSSRCIRQESFGGGASEKSTRGKDQGDTPRRGGAAKGVTPGSFSSQVLNRETSHPRTLHRAETAPVPKSGSFAEAMAGQRGKNGGGSSRRTGSPRRSNLTRRGTFLEASDSKWSEFIEKVEKDNDK